MVNLVLAEDHEMVREGLRGIIEKEPDLHVAAEARDGNEAIEKVEECKPDILVLDLTLPRRHGLSVLTAFSRRKILKVIILTMHRDEASVLEALRLGARGYVIKDAPSSDLIAAIRAVLRDELYVSEPLRPLVTRAALQVLSGQAASKPILTRQELVVLQLAAEGKRNDAVAKSLGISVRTAEKHRSNLMRKLNLRSQSELLRYAIRHNVAQA